MSALPLMADEREPVAHASAPSDTVILSSHPIPGNETNVSKVIDGLAPPRRRGRALRHRRRARHRPRQAGGDQDAPVDRASRECFIPVHGEYRHLVPPRRARPQVMGVPPSDVLICEDGDQLDARRRRHPRQRGEVPAGYLYVDGIVGDVGHGVLRDRRVLAEEGVVVVIVTVDVEAGAIITGPEIITRGWVYAPEAEDLLDEAPTSCARPSRTCSPRPARPTSRRSSAHVRKAAGRFVNDRTKRRPMIVPVVMEA